MKRFDVEPKASCTPGKYWIERNISISPKFGKVATCLGENEIWPGLFDRAMNSLFNPTIEISLELIIFGFRLIS